MKFVEVAETFNKIEEESSRTAITRLLAELLGKATPEEASIISYLSIGELNPPYIGTQFNFAEKSVVKVLADLIDKSESTVSKNAKSLGDMGLVVEEGDWRHKGGKDLTVSQVYDELQDFLKVSGTGSQGKKEKKFLDLLSKLNPISAKFVVRIVLGKLRLGFSDMTLIDAFSWMKRGDKSLRKMLEGAYNVSADIGHIAKTLKKEGVRSLEKSVVTPGVPVRPAAAERLADAKAIIKKVGECIAQPKLDGFRLQVHVFKDHGKKVVKFFSRNLQDMSEMFPELSDAVSKLKVKDLIVEGEAIAYDVETDTFLPFQETVKRRRKHDIEETKKDVPLKLYFFDLLYLNGESLLDKTQTQRKKALDSIFKNAKEEKDIVLPIEEVDIKTAEELSEYFNQNVSDGLEGVIVKKKDSIYQPGKRNFNWIKLKREESGKLDDTIDCVILGYYSGHGKRSKFGIGALLIGVYNPDEDRFETVAKIGTGLSDEGWKEQKKMCDAVSVKEKPKNVVCAKELAPDVWTSPELVCIIRADEITVSPLHSAGKTKSQPGYALRFPRIMGYRTDKSSVDSTTVKEIEDLYKIQFKKKKKKSK